MSNWCKVSRMPRLLRSGRANTLHHSLSLSIICSFCEVHHQPVFVEGFLLRSLPQPPSKLHISATKCRQCCSSYPVGTPRIESMLQFRGHQVQVHRLYHIPWAALFELTSLRFQYEMLLLFPHTVLLFMFQFCVHPVVG